MDCEEVIVNFKKSITAANSPIAKLEVIADSLGVAFGVGRNEVALFSFDKSREVLVLVWPYSQKSIGSIPLNAHRCLVSKTAVDKKGRMDNSFASTPHLYMFEHFLAEKSRRVPIQKIMSFPVNSGDNLIGVVQIAKKGQDRDSAGADFTTADLAALASIADVIADYM